ncbi:DNA-3-methyladenine glycosylase I [Flavobacterium sp.]|uniref:DNA-3-methyladenine glycosylase I n=1 Tax=Flavobacterium sp. TaxID=239 RepID=UPI00333EAE0D
MENKIRCAWCEKDDLYRNYHDNEWGKPVYDDQMLFEFLILETFQAGLSWYTVLKKRENFRKAFANFDYKKVALFSEEKIQELLLDVGIIRNQLKIRAAVANAIAFMKVQEEFGTFSKYIWNFTDGKPLDNKPKTLKDISSSTPLSDAISKDLKIRGFKFVGTTVVYAHMQATGMVNDHVENCWTRN